MRLHVIDSGVSFLREDEKSERVRCPKCLSATGFYLYQVVKMMDTLAGADQWVKTGIFYMKCQACRFEIPVDVKLLGLG